MESIVVFQAGTALKDGETVTAGGRVLGVTSVRSILESALLSGPTGRRADLVRGNALPPGYRVKDLRPVAADTPPRDAPTSEKVTLREAVVYFGQ
jgi:hypothetical protein